MLVGERRETGGSSQTDPGNSAKQTIRAAFPFASFIPLPGCHFSNIFNKQKLSVESMVIIGIYHDCQSRCAGKTHLSCLNQLSRHGDHKLSLGNQLQENYSFGGVM